MQATLAKLGLTVAVRYSAAEEEASKRDANVM